MIEIRIFQPPYVLQEFLEELRPMFGRRSYRQSCRFMTASWVSSARPIAYLNGVFIDHTAKSNLSRFVRNVDSPSVFGKSVNLINRFSTDSVMVIDETTFQQSGKHIQRSDLVYYHSGEKHCGEYLRSLWQSYAVRAYSRCTLISRL